MAPAAYHCGGVGGVQFGVGLTLTRVVRGDPIALPEPIDILPGVNDRPDDLVAGYKLWGFSRSVPGRRAEYSLGTLK
jgi:hypothetical protein